MSMHPSPCDGESAPSDSDIRSHISCRTDTHSEDEYIGTDDDFSSFEYSVSILTSRVNVNDLNFSMLLATNFFFFNNVVFL